MFRKIQLPILLSSALAFVSAGAFAQNLPDSGKLLQETRPATESPTPVIAPITAPETAPRVVVPSGGDVRVEVTTFGFVGNKSISTEELRQSVAQWEGKSLTFGELMQVVETVEARYKNAGYFLAQAYLPPQKIRSGSIDINISEGFLGETRLEGESRVNADVLFAYLDKLPRDEALRMPPLERQIMLINELAGGTAALDLQAGENPSTSDVVLAQTPEAAVTGRWEANNHGAPSTGTNRAGLTANANSYFGLGERITAYAMGSDTSMLATYNLRGDLPVGGDGWRMTAAATRVEYAVGGAYANLKMSGIADSLRWGVSYPFIRSRNVNLKMLAEMDETALQDRNNGGPTSKHIQGLTLTISGDRQDSFLGSGTNRFDAGFRTGYFHYADDATSAFPAEGSHGGFNKFTLTLARQQVLSREWSASLQVTGQNTMKNLDSGEKFNIGGPASLPGYSSGADGYGVGDMGYYTKLGLRWQALPIFAITAFADEAFVTLAKNPTEATSGNNHRRLADAGLAFDWTLTKTLNWNTTVARATRPAANSDDNDLPRVWTSLGLAW